VRSRRDEEELA